MKRLLAAFLVLAVPMVLTIGNTGCTKKPETQDKAPEKGKAEKDKKADSVMVPKSPVPPKETPTLEPDVPRKKDEPTPPPPPIPLPPKEEKKPSELPKLDPPPSDPKKDSKGASLDRPMRLDREILVAAFERRTTIW
jgi:hypothetical protein